MGAEKPWRGSPCRPVWGSRGAAPGPRQPLAAPSDGRRGLSGWPARGGTRGRAGRTGRAHNATH
eukprot:3287114-Lingulodinium_polyedra.AAC.1